MTDGNASDVYLAYADVNDIKACGVYVSLFAIVMSRRLDRKLYDLRIVVEGRFVVGYRCLGWRASGEYQIP